LRSFFFTNSSSSSSRSISLQSLIRVALVRVSHERVFSCSQKTLLRASLSLFFSLSLCVFSLCESKSALFITPHDASSTTRRSALRRKDIESTMHDFNARKPAKNFGTRLFKDDVCSYNKYPRDSVRKTASADFIAREIQSPKCTRVCRLPFFVVFFPFSIKFARRKTR